LWACHTASGHEYRPLAGQGQGFGGLGFVQDHDLCAVVDHAAVQFDELRHSASFLFDGGVAIHADLERVEADAADGFDETLAVEALGPVHVDEAC
jgi:hypothetical protein